MSSAEEEQQELFDNINIPETYKPTMPRRRRLSLGKPNTKVHYSRGDIIEARDTPKSISLPNESRISSRLEDMSSAKYSDSIENQRITGELYITKEVVESLHTSASSDKEETAENVLEGTEKRRFIPPHRTPFRLDIPPSSKAPKPILQQTSNEDTPNVHDESNGMESKDAKRSPDPDASVNMRNMLTQRKTHIKHRFSDVVGVRGYYSSYLEYMRTRIT